MSVIEKCTKSIPTKPLEKLLSKDPRTLKLAKSRQSEDFSKNNKEKHENSRKYYSIIFTK